VSSLVDVGFAFPLLDAWKKFMSLPIIKNFAKIIYKTK